MKSIFWEKKEGKYATTLAKFKVTAIFLMQDMRRNLLPKFIDLYWDAMLVPIRMATSKAAGNQLACVAGGIVAARNKVLAAKPREIPAVFQSPPLHSPRGSLLAAPLSKHYSARLHYRQLRRLETNRNICRWVLLQKCEFISRGTQKH